MLAHLLPNDAGKHTFLPLSSLAEHPVNAFIHFYAYKKKRDLKPHRSDLEKFISLAGRGGEEEEEKTLESSTQSQTSIGTFFLILVFLLGRKIKKAPGNVVLDTAKSKRRKRALSHQEGGGRAATLKELCMEQQR